MSIIVINLISRGIGMHDYEQLQNENLYLKKIIAKLMQRQDVGDFSNILTKRSSLSEKIRLLKALFLERLDVYAIRFVSKDGRNGYMLARRIECQSQVTNQKQPTSK